MLLSLAVALIVTPWLELGMLDEWLKRIHELKALNASFIHTGRGASGDNELLENQEIYLKDVINIVKKYHPEKVTLNKNLGE